MVSRRFALWEKAGASQRLLDTPHDRARLSAERVTTPSAAITDSQPARTAETVPR